MQLLLEGGRLRGLHKGKVKRRERERERREEERERRGEEEKKRERWGSQVFPDFKAIVMCVFLVAPRPSSKRLAWLGSRHYCSLFDSFRARLQIHDISLWFLCL